MKRPEKCEKGRKRECVRENEREGEGVGKSERKREGEKKKKMFLDLKFPYVLTMRYSRLSRY